MLACVSSRPGQCGRCDGYILEGKELEFYIKKIEKKKWLLLDFDKNSNLKKMQINALFTLIFFQFKIFILFVEEKVFEIEKAICANLHFISFWFTKN